MIDMKAERMKTNLLIILALISLSCSPDYESKCKADCGKLIESWHYRADKIIKLTYVSECGDTIVNSVKLTEEQLSNDNGISYYVGSFNVGMYYCE